jgi:predicted transcriptional regulator
MVQQRLLTIDYGNSDKILGALVSTSRRRIVQLLASRTLNINQIAAELGLPQSTVATNVKILEDAGLIEVTLCAAAKGGSQKNCTLAYDNLAVKLNPLTKKLDENVIETQMPIGLYSDFSVNPSCGMCSKDKIIGFLDVPKSFYNPERASAELLWFAKGFIEYKFPNNLPPNRKVKSLELCVELCSEAPGFNENWPSDITVWVNGREIGTWTSPGDFGGIRGKLTPAWWRLNATQFGLLKHWIVKEDCAYIDGERSSEAGIADLNLHDSHSIRVRLGIKEDAANSGGINLFGKAFGNYEQDLLLRLELG